MLLLLREFICQVLLEQQISDKDAEAPKGAELGRIAFALERPWKPREKNTKIENELYKAIKRFFSDSEFLSSKQCQLLQKILSQGWYTDIIKTPEVDIVYRGMIVREQWLKTVIELNDNAEISDEGIKEFSFTFTPQNNSSSWTQDEEVADGFAQHGSAMWVGLNTDFRYQVKLFANVQDNLNMLAAGVNGLYTIDEFSPFEMEQEVIGLGSIKVFKIEWTKIT